MCSKADAVAVGARKEAAGAGVARFACALSLRLAAVVQAGVALAAVAEAQQNLGFEESVSGEPMLPRAWELGADEDTVRLDRAIVRQGRYSLRMTGSGGRSRATQSIPVAGAGGNRVRIRVQARTESVTGGYAGLWVRVDGPDGLLYLDSMRGRGLDGTAGWTELVVDAPLAPQAEEIEFGPVLRGSGNAWFDDLTFERFDAARLPPAEPAALRYLQRALVIIRRHSIRRQAIDWPAFEAAVMEQARGARSVEDSYLALRHALGLLGDGHSYLMVPGQAASLRSRTVSNARTGREARPPRIERLTAKVGYVWMPGFAGGSQTDQRVFAETLHAGFAALESHGVCAWIVDLRDNEGGNLWPMLAGIGPLLGDGEVGAAVYPDGRRVRFWYRDGKAGFGDYVQLRVSAPAYQPAVDSPPVALLSSEETASSAETILTAFRGRPRARSFGEATRGLNSGNRTFRLSDDAELVLTVAATSDRNGTVYAGPIVPDQPVGNPPGGGPLLGQSAVAAALAWLGEEIGPGCPTRMKQAGGTRDAAFRVDVGNPESSAGARATAP